MTRVSAVSRRAAGVLVAIVFAAVAFVAAAAKSDGTVDARARSEVVDYVLNALNGSYVFPEVAAKMSDAVRERVAKGEYDAITGARGFADKLTADLQAVSRDKHLRVRLTGQHPLVRMVRRLMSGDEGDDGGGFARVEQLPGNIGYIDLRLFHGPSVAAKPAADAMNRLADSDALIIDLRQNRGGSSEMVALLASYLLRPERILVNTFVNREGRVNGETWTTTDLPGKRFLGKDVYLLTSASTASAAEEFAHDLKNWKRATIVGETTRGAANPAEVFRINRQFEISIPVSRAVNPVTGSNWEGVGVEPDLRVPAADALQTAHLAALEKRLEHTRDPAQRTAIEDAIRAGRRTSPI